MVTRRATDSPMDPETPIQEAPNNDATLRDSTPAGTAVDASQKPTLSKLWDNWTSRPENNAALINFGLNMMQPKYPGETGLSHFANAVGAGAEASQRNIGAQEERSKREEEEALKEREATRKESETEAYGRSVDALAAQRGGKVGLKELQAKAKAYATAKAGFAKWLDDPIGMDTFWKDVSERYGVKDKIALRRNPEIRSKVEQEYIRDHMPEAATSSGYYDREGDTGSGGSTGAPSPVDLQALQWARANPSDPRAAQILQRLGQ